MKEIINKGIVILLMMILIALYFWNRQLVWELQEKETELLESSGVIDSLMGEGEWIKENELIKPN